MAATPAAPRLRVPRPMAHTGALPQLSSRALQPLLGIAALGVSVGVCAAIALAAAERRSPLSGPAQHGFPAWMVGPFGRRVPGLPRHAPALDETGERRFVDDGFERLLARGNGAVRQRRTFEETGDLVAVV